AAEWLIQTGRTTSAKLAIFGGSNSGLLVGAAITQRPETQIGLRVLSGRLPIFSRSEICLFQTGEPSQMRM
ncbi:MAG: prolyl oligopeptidase family serine peptidase, partial [Nitrospirae bacterium]|nr:prolyl oligopeptidase family serine peptidase [Nitrospirota bacterium]